MPTIKMIITTSISSLVFNTNSNYHINNNENNDTIDNVNTIHTINESNEPKNTNGYRIVTVNNNEKNNIQQKFIPLSF